MNFNPNFEEIGNAFIQHYYSKFDVQDPTARSSGLSDLYDPMNSYMTFEGVQVKGRDSILQKFAVSTFVAKEVKSVINFSIEMCVLSRNQTGDMSVAFLYINPVDFILSFQLFLQEELNCLEAKVAK